MNWLVRVGALTAIWCLLWGEVSVANVVSGAVLSAILLVAFPVRGGERRGERAATRFRPVGAARFAVHVLVQFIVSNALVAREIVARRSRVRTGIVACPLRTESETLITLLANVLALSPGTMPVDVQTSPPVIHIHVLVLRDVAQARRDVARLEELAVGAFGSDEDVARLGSPALYPEHDDPGAAR